MAKLVKYLFVCFSIGGYQPHKSFSCGLGMINLFLPNLKICLFLNVIKPCMNEKTANPKRLMTFKQTSCLRNGGVKYVDLQIYTFLIVWFIKLFFRLLPNKGQI